MARAECARGREGGGECRDVTGWGQVIQGPVGCREDVGLYLEGGGSPGELWVEGIEPGHSGAHRRPLAAWRRTDFGGIRWR